MDTENPFLLKTPWDKGDRYGTKPPVWTIDKVQDLLQGIEAKKEWRYKKGARDKIQHRYADVQFICGCKAFEDRGWQPCSDALHEVLACYEPTSPLVKRFTELRAKFAALLAWAWENNPQRPEDSLLRSFGKAPTVYREEHDLEMHAIWRYGAEGSGLSADLRPASGTAEIELFNGGTQANPAPTLILTIEEPQVDYGSQESRDIDVSDMTVDEIIRLIKGNSDPA